MTTTQEERAFNAAAIRRQREEKKQYQDNCTHQRRDGHSNCVHVVNEYRGERTEYLLCQFCQKKIFTSDPAYAEHFVTILWRWPDKADKGPIPAPPVKPSLWQRLLHCLHIRRIYTEDELYIMPLGKLRTLADKQIKAATRAR